MSPLGLLLFMSLAPGGELQGQPPLIPPPPPPPPPFAAPRDPTPNPKGTAVITGRVLRADTPVTSRFPR